MAKEHEAAEKGLAGEGEGKKKKLHTHELHIRRGHAGGYIARHDLRDENDQAHHQSHEYPLLDHKEMLAHLSEHMGEQPAAGGGESEGGGEKNDPNEDMG